jgi:hypothetical protein
MVSSNGLADASPADGTRIQAAQGMATDRTGSRPEPSRGVDT